jgi:hypothetical protein
MAHLPGRHTMELHLSFHRGVMSGEGRDLIGAFLIHGRYSVDDGKCRWTKKYIGKHDVAYNGYNEGRGIWGIWDIPPSWRGGFYIWPKAMGDPTLVRLAEAVDTPVEILIDEDIGAPSVAEPATVGAATGS